MSFYQEPPHLGNQYTDDALLGEYLARVLEPSHLTAIEGDLHLLGDLAGGALYRQQLDERSLLPELTQWDAWGKRVDQIRLTPLWERAKTLSAEHGLVAVAYEREHGAASRIEQMARAYLLAPSIDVYACPLAMTDGAARTLLDLDAKDLIARAVPHLTSRDSRVAWTSGQWMTERTGGSDVGLSESIAKKSPDGTWRLYGTKWFTSATTSEMALALARPEGNPAGSRGLALFYVELTRRDDGALDGISINRLKDKLGTRKVPTAELTLDGAPAIPVAGLDGGVKNIASMLTVTRMWNASMSTSGMTRALHLARSYAARRRAFGDMLANKPLHSDTLATIEAERDGAFLLSFRAVELLGQKEAGEADERALNLLRVLTPLAKLTTGKQAVAIASEALESFGGAGYIEDTGLPHLLRDAQVLPIWEGTTNVLSLDLLRALEVPDAARAIFDEIARLLAPARASELATPTAIAERAANHAVAWLEQTRNDSRAREAGARRFAITLGRTLSLALLCAHAAWCFEHSRGPRACDSARRYAALGVDLIFEGSP